MQNFQIVNLAFLSDSDENIFKNKNKQTKQNKKIS